MPIPSPQERPDLYDDYDCRPDGIRPGEKEYWDNLFSKEMKQAIATRMTVSEQRPVEESEEPSS